MVPEQPLSELLYRKWQPLKACTILLYQLALCKERDVWPSILNRLKDYFKIRSCLDLHYRLQQILEEQTKSYDSWDYGQSYFYQSCKPVNISGFRNTEARISFYKIADYVKDKTVLDIGCNAGFLDIECAAFAKSIAGFDINPYCIKLGQTVADYLKVNNVRLFPSTFEAYNESVTYDVVLSLANHHTYDHNTIQSLDDYFNKCASYLTKDGVLLFESHAIVYENNEQLEQVLKVISKFFNIQEQRVFQLGNRGDKGRTFCVCVKK